MITLIYEKIVKFIEKEYLFFITLLIFITTLLYSKKAPHISIEELKVLAILFMLFISIKGLDENGFVKLISLKIEQGSLIATKLIIGTFFLSTFLTNDVALIAIVPITLSLNIKNKALIVILEAIAANAGSALSPFGNPQNLYIYLFYNLNLIEFLKIVTPMVAFNFIILTLISLFINPKRELLQKEAVKIDTFKTIISLLALTLTVLTILSIIPLKIAFIAVAISLIFYPKALKIDYFLLLIFAMFFAITNALSPTLSNYIQNIKDIFLFSTLSSQIISNVPTALLFAKFTQNYQDLLWGVNVGGFGFIVGSLANLIAYKLFSAKVKEKNFFMKFNAINFAFLALNIALYYLLFSFKSLQHIILYF